MRCELSPPELSGLVTSPHVSFTVNSSCRGRSQGWMSHSTQVLVSLSGLGLLGLNTASAPAKADVLPREKSTSSCS